MASSKASSLSGYVILSIYLQITNSFEVDLHGHFHSPVICWGAEWGCLCWWATYKKGQDWWSLPMQVNKIAQCQSHGHGWTGYSQINHICHGHSEFRYTVLGHSTDISLQLLMNLTCMTSWGITHNRIHYQELYNFFVDYFEQPTNPTSAAQVKDLLKWWNDWVLCLVFTTLSDSQTLIAPFFPITYLPRLLVLLKNLETGSTLCKWTRKILVSEVAGFP